MQPSDNKVQRQSELPKAVFLVAKATGDTELIVTLRRFCLKQSSVAEGQAPSAIHDAWMDLIVYLGHRLWSESGPHDLAHAEQEVVKSLDILSSGN